MPSIQKLKVCWQWFYLRQVHQAALVDSGGVSVFERRVIA